MDRRRRRSVAAAAVAVAVGAAGNCSAGGYYSDDGDNLQAFVVSETSGTWGTAEQVPGTATLNQGGFAQVNSVSCPTAASCAAGGFYDDGAKLVQAFVVNKR